MRKNFSAFTLAEVLITLGIIGVVAAMTMPTLMNATQGAQYKTAFKKALSALSQAVTLNMALDDWNFSDVDSGDGTGESDQTVLKILLTRMNYVKNDTTVPEVYGTLAKLNQAGAGAGADASNLKADEKIITDADRFVYFADGIMFAYSEDNAASCNKDTPCEGFVDVNGDKGPNKIVTCSGTYTEAVAESGPKGQEGYVAAKEATCSEVKSPTDIYPVYFFDQTVIPKSAAAKAVLYGK